MVNKLQLIKTKFFYVGFSPECYKKLGTSWCSVSLYLCLSKTGLVGKCKNNASLSPSMMHKISAKYMKVGPGFKSDVTLGKKLKH